MPVVAAITTNKPHAGVGLRRRRRRWSLPGRALAGKVDFPIVHEAPPPLEQVRPCARRLDLVADNVGEHRLDDLAWMVRLLGRPVPERRPKPSATAGMLQSRTRVSFVPSSCLPGAGEHQRVVAVAERPRASRISMDRPHSGRGARRAPPCERRGRPTRWPSVSISAVEAGEAPTLAGAVKGASGAGACRARS